MAKILLVEDNEMNRDMLSRRLTKRGYEVVVAVDGQAGVDAAYYVRVLQNPTCRWSTYDAMRLGRDVPAGVPKTVRERAWSSPIWVPKQPS